MDHSLFKPKSIEEGKHNVVGDCNGFSMEDRWEVETPLFVEEIVKYAPKHATILDYGCGVGRLSKEILKQRDDVQVVGVDASAEMLEQSTKYVDHPSFIPSLPGTLWLLNVRFDLCYCIYVLQHCPAVDLRTSLQRIHYFLKDDGTFVYCSSDYRMAIRFDEENFFDDRFLGVNLQEEVGRLFGKRHDLFSDAQLKSNALLDHMIRGGLQHPAHVYCKQIFSESAHMFDASSGSIIPSKAP
jgi:SAM-dependent methyltransferase